MTISWKLRLFMKLESIQIHEFGCTNYHMSLNTVPTNYLMNLNTLQITRVFKLKFVNTVAVTRIHGRTLCQKHIYVVYAHMYNTLKNEPLII